MQNFKSLSADSQFKVLSKLDKKAKTRLLKLIKEYELRLTYKLYKLFPEEGELSRHEYVKHMQFFQGGTAYRARLFMAGNRVGKTVTGAYEGSLHATGLYPDWWTEENGCKRFNTKTDGWVAGKTNETTRDIIQKELFGNVVYINGKKTVDCTGVIPKHLVDRKSIRWKQGVADLIDFVRVKHVSGEWSSIGLKSYQQGRGAFEGTERHWIWLDEEPEQWIYTECVTRTATTQGIVMVTFTPLEGTTEMVDDFIRKADEGINLLIQAGWDDAPHLTEKDKADLLAIFPEHEHEARSKGIPYAGSGLIFPIKESEIVIEPFAIPKHWARLTGMDFGWDHPTAAINLAWDRDNDIVYLVDEYGASKKTPIEHAPHIRALCHFAPVAFPHDGLQHDKGGGEQMREQYVKQGVNMTAERATFEDGSNSVEAGLMMMLTRMQQGKLKVFKHCVKWIEERRMYHRENGKIVKRKDDYMDASRYALMMLRYAVTEPILKTRQERRRSKL